MVALFASMPFYLRAQSTLAKYLDEALRNNLGLQSADFALEKSLYALKEAKGLFLPDVNFSTQYLASGGGRKIEIPVGDLLNPVYTSLNNLTGSTKFPQIENVSQTFNPNNYYDAKVRTSMPLFNAEITYNTRIRGAQISLQQAQLSVYKRELIKNVKVAYYTYQQILGTISILENGLIIATENLRINQTLVKNGKAIRTVVSRAENEVTGLQAQLQEARLQVVSAAGYFNFLLNKPLNAVVDIDANTGIPLLGDTTTTGSRREELVAYASVVKVRSLETGMRKSAYLPKINTFLDLGAQGDFLTINRQSPYYLLGVTASWQIFAGNQNKNRIQQAAVEQKSAESQAVEAEKRLALEALTATNTYHAAVENYTAAVSQASLSKQYLKDEQRLYKEGQALYLELLDAQSRLISDDIKQSIAFLTVQIRHAELERAKASYQF